MWCRPHCRAILAYSQLGQAGHRKSPESPGTVRNHLGIVAALGEERETDLTPQPGRHNHDDLGARPKAKAKRAPDDLVKLIKQMQLHAITGTEYRVLDQQVAILSATGTS